DLVPGVHAAALDAVDEADPGLRQVHVVEALVDPGTPGPVVEALVDPGTPGPVVEGAQTVSTVLPGTVRSPKRYRDRGRSRDLSFSVSAPARRVTGGCGTSRRG